MAGAWACTAEGESTDKSLLLWTSQYFFNTLMPDVAWHHHGHFADDQSNSTLLHNPLMPVTSHNPKISLSPSSDARALSMHRISSMQSSFRRT